MTTNQLFFTSTLQYDAVRSSYVACAHLLRFWMPKHQTKTIVASSLSFFKNSFHAFWFLRLAISPIRWNPSLRPRTELCLLQLACSTVGHCCLLLFLHLQICSINWLPCPSLCGTLSLTNQTEHSECLLYKFYYGSLTITIQTEHSECLVVVFIFSSRAEPNTHNVSLFGRAEVDNLLVLWCQNDARMIRPNRDLRLVPQFVETPLCGHVQNFASCSLHVQPSAIVVCCCFFIFKSVRSTGFHVHRCAAPYLSRTKPNTLNVYCTSFTMVLLLLRSKPNTLNV